MTARVLPEINLTPELVATAAEAKAWPFEEAQKLVKRYEKTGYPDTILFETGYITNADDVRFLASAEGQSRIAKGVAKAVEIHFARQLAQN